jgi:hypothetical protein
METTARSDSTGSPEKRPLLSGNGKLTSQNDDAQQRVYILYPICIQRPPTGSNSRKRSFLPRFRNSVIIIPANCAFCNLNCAKCLFVAIQEPITKNVICTQIRAFYVFLRVCNCAITKKAILL